MTKKKLIQLIREERKNWDNEELEPAIVAVLDREDGWTAAYKTIPKAWLDENKEEIEGYVRFMETLIPSIDGQLCSGYSRSLARSTPRFKRRDKV
ncbi:MAG: hypothetical protein KO464_02340 [Candidatus Methanofastidiosum sp.]|nr:hypothetical protein [Methanofastidiosum sp.]